MEFVGAWRELSAKLKTLRAIDDDAVHESGIVGLVHEAKPARTGIPRAQRTDQFTLLRFGELKNDEEGRGRQDVAAHLRVDHPVRFQCDATRCIERRVGEPRVLPGFGTDAQQRVTLELDGLHEGRFLFRPAGKGL